MLSKALPGRLTGLRVVFLSLVALFIAISAPNGAPTDYQFTAATPSLKVGPGALITIRLVHRPTGKPVGEAVLFRVRLDMSPAGMADMATDVSPLPSAEAGIYRFRADLPHAGDWALTVQAKVPGEAATVTGNMLVKVIQ